MGAWIAIGGLVAPGLGARVGIKVVFVCSWRT